MRTWHVIPDIPETDEQHRDLMNTPGRETRRVFVRDGRVHDWLTGLQLDGEPSDELVAAGLLLDRSTSLLAFAVLEETDATSR